MTTGDQIIKCIRCGALYYQILGHKCTNEEPTFFDLRPPLEQRIDKLERRIAHLEGFLNECYPDERGLV